MRMHAHEPVFILVIGVIAQAANDNTFGRNAACITPAKTLSPLIVPPDDMQCAKLVSCCQCLAWVIPHGNSGQILPDQSVGPKEGIPTN